MGDGSLGRGIPLTTESGDYVECQRQFLEVLLEKSQMGQSQGKGGWCYGKKSVASDNKLGGRSEARPFLHWPERPFPMASFLPPPSQTQPGTPLSERQTLRPAMTIQ